MSRFGPGSAANQPSQAPKSAVEIEREQAAKLASKYGGLVAKKNLLPKDHKFFDSADWALSKQGQKPVDAAEAAPGPPPTSLRPKLGPELDDDKPNFARRSSHLGDSGELSSLAAAARPSD